MRFECWFDGGCGPINPGGYATSGAIVYSEGKPIWWHSEFIGNGPKFSNNVAEYAGILAVLQYLQGVLNPGDSVVIYGDSDLVVKQMTGKWKAKKGLYIPWYVKARNALDAIRFKCDLLIKWVPREQNEEADQLCRDAFPLHEVH